MTGRLTAEKHQLAFLREAESMKSYRNIVSKAANEAIDMIVKN